MTVWRILRSFFTLSLFRSFACLFWAKLLPPTNHRMYPKPKLRIASWRQSNIIKHTTERKKVFFFFKLRIYCRLHNLSLLNKGKSMSFPCFFSLHVWQIYWMYSSSQRKQFILFDRVQEREKKANISKQSSQQRHIHPQYKMYTIHILRFLNTNQFAHSLPPSHTSTCWQFQFGLLLTNKSKLSNKSKEMKRIKTNQHFHCCSSEWFGSNGKWE